MRQVYDVPRNHIQWLLDELYAVTEMSISPQEMMQRALDQIKFMLVQGNVMCLPMGEWSAEMLNAARQAFDRNARQSWNTQPELHHVKGLVKFMARRIEIMATRAQLSRGQTPVGGRALPPTRAEIRETLCKQCGGEHPLYKCLEFLQMSIEQREREIARWELCVVCTRTGHMPNQCYLKECNYCGQWHNAALCRLPQAVENTAEMITELRTKTARKNNPQTTGAIPKEQTHSNQINSGKPWATVVEESEAEDRRLKLENPFRKLPTVAPMEPEPKAPSEKIVKEQLSEAVATAERIAKKKKITIDDYRSRNGAEKIVLSGDDISDNEKEQAGATQTVRASDEEATKKTHYGISDPRSTMEDWMLYSVGLHPSQTALPGNNGTSVAEEIPPEPIEPIGTSDSPGEPMEVEQNAPETSLPQELDGDATTVLTSPGNVIAGAQVNEIVHQMHHWAGGAKVITGWEGMEESDMPSAIPLPPWSDHGGLSSAEEDALLNDDSLVVEDQQVMQEIDKMASAQPVRDHTGAPEGPAAHGAERMGPKSETCDARNNVTK